MSAKRIGVALCAVFMVCVVGVADAAIAGGKPAPSSQTNGRVNSIAIQNGIAYIGGQFTQVRPAGASSGGVVRNRAAAINLSTGAVTAFDPNLNGTVQAVAVDGSTVFLGGSFTQAGGKAAGRLVAVNATTGAVIWRATLNAEIVSLVVGHGNVYAGGYFITANGASRSHLAAFSESTGALDAAWTPTTDLEVKALVLTTDGSKIVVGGDFDTINGSRAAHLGAVDPTTGATAQWSTHTPYQVIDMANDANGVYVAGAGSGGNFSAFNPSTGRMLWQGGTDGNVQGIGVLQGIVYVGGHYTNYCGPQGGQHTCTAPVARSKLLAVDAGTGALQAFDPGANSVLGIFAVEGSGTWLTIGGDFTKTGGIAQQGFARYSTVPVDTTAPTVTKAPTMVVSKGVTLGTATVPVHVSYLATDPSGVCDYNLQSSFASGAYVTAALATPASTSANLSIAPSPKAYRFQVSATDCKGNTSQYAPSAATVLTSYQNSSASIKYAGAWSTSTVAGTFGGTQKYTKAANASASLTFTGREVAWVATRATSRGAARVYIDGVLAGTVNTFATATAHRRVVFTRAFAAGGSHTIKIVGAGTAGHPIVDIDALLVVR